MQVPAESGYFAGQTHRTPKARLGQQATPTHRAEKVGGWHNADEYCDQRQGPGDALDEEKSREDLAAGVAVHPPLAGVTLHEHFLWSRIHANEVGEEARVLEREANKHRRLLPPINASEKVTGGQEAIQDKFKGASNGLDNNIEPGDDRKPARVEHFQMWFDSKVDFDHDDSIAQED